MRAQQFWTKLVFSSFYHIGKTLNNSNMELVMAHKAKIFQSVPVTRLNSRIPAEYHCLVNLARLNKPVYTLVVFPVSANNSHTIVTSALLQKTLRKRPDWADPVIVLAHALTDEAASMIRNDADVLVFTQTDFFWTDASVRRVSQHG